MVEERDRTENRDIPEWAQQETNNLNCSSKDDLLRFLGPKINSTLIAFANNRGALDWGCCDIFGNWETNSPNVSDHHRIQRFWHSVMMIDPQEALKYLNDPLFHVTTSLVFPPFLADDSCLTGDQELVSSTAALSPGRELYSFHERMYVENKTARIGPELLRLFLPDWVTLPSGKIAGYFYTDMLIWASSTINLEMWEETKHGVILTPRNFNTIRQAIETVFDNYLSWANKDALDNQIVPEVARAWQKLGVLGFWQRELSTPLTFRVIQGHYYCPRPLEAELFDLKYQKDSFIRNAEEFIQKSSAKPKPLWQETPFPLALQIRPKTPDTASLYLFSARPMTNVPLFKSIALSQVERIIVDKENLAVAEEMLRVVFGNKRYIPVVSREELQNRTIESCLLPYGDDPNNTLRYFADLLFSGRAIFLLSSIGRLDSLKVFDSQKLSPRQLETVRYGFFTIEDI